MLQRYSEIFRTLLLVADLGLVALSWAGAYLLRFQMFPPATGWNPDTYLYGAGLAVSVAFWNFRARGLYEPMRTGSLWRETGNVVAAIALTLVVLLAVDAALRTFFSRSMLATFAALSVVSIVAFRVTGRSLLRAARRRGHNLRYVLVVGAGETARGTVASIHGHPEAGMRVLGILTNDLTLQGRTIEGVQVIGYYAAVKSALGRRRIDQVVVALPREDADHLEKILADLEDEFVTVRLIPDLLHVMTLRSSVEELDGLPVINLRDSPLIGWSAIQKRAFDVCVSLAGLVIGAPVLALVALGVWATSGRPVLYRQERMGLDGRVFECLKFRTMRHDAESQSGPVWTVEDDPRRTRFGAFLRASNLDELTQLWNVLRGDMSFVGTRPERPVFIEQFRREIPGYMLRHKVKAGLTGWAQVHGWRGNTSIHERIEHDIYYIQNWSLGLDVQILLMTFWRAFGRNAY